MQYLLYSSHQPDKVGATDEKVSLDTVPYISEQDRKVRCSQEVSGPQSMLSIMLTHCRNNDEHMIMGSLQGKRL